MDQSPKYEDILDLYWLVLKTPTKSSHSKCALKEVEHYIQEQKKK